jgi:hypothetical protein
VLAIVVVRFGPWRKTDPPPVAPAPPGPVEQKPAPPPAPNPTPALAPPLAPTTTLGGQTGYYVVYIEAAPGAFYTPVETWPQTTETAAALAKRYGYPYTWTPEAKPGGGYRIKVAYGFMGAVGAVGFCAQFDREAGYKGRLTCNPTYQPRTGSQAAAIVRGQ